MKMPVFCLKPRVLAHRALDLTPALAALSLTLIAGTAHALVGAYRQPINAVDGEHMYQLSQQDMLSVNPEREVVTSKYGSDTVSSIEINQVQGTIKGYTSYALYQDTYVPRPGVPGLVNVDGKMVFMAKVAQAAGVPATASPQTAVFEWSVHGAFKDVVGQPWLALAGSLAVNHYIGGMASGLENDYASSVAFRTATEIGWVAGVDAKLDNSLVGASGDDPRYTEATWAAGSRIVSAVPDELRAVLRLSVPIAAGDDLVLINLLAAGASHAYAQLPESVPIGDDILVKAASGAVDFSNTGLLRIYLPQGLTLTGPNAPAEALLATSSVPEPTTMIMLLAGLGALALCRRQQR